MVLITIDCVGSSNHDRNGEWWAYITKLTTQGFCIEKKAWAYTRLPLQGDNFVYTLLSLELRNRKKKITTIACPCQLEAYM